MFVSLTLHLKNVMPLSLQASVTAFLCSAKFASLCVFMLVCLWIVGQWIEYKYMPSTLRYPLIRKFSIFALTGVLPGGWTNNVFLYCVPDHLPILSLLYTSTSRYYMYYILLYQKTKHPHGQLSISPGSMPLVKQDYFLTAQRSPPSDAAAL